jgi:ribosomal protein S12 methylthiotransferase
VKLLDRLAAVEGIEWIRLLYLHPARTGTRLIEWIGGHDKAVPYFDLPLQHVNTEVLRWMKRESNRKTIERLLAEIGDRAPHATLRVSFMVGFPGETKAQFKELCEFATERRFDRLGVFAFSPEEGTAAAALSPKVSPRVKAERMDRLMTLQQAIAFEKNNSLIGTEVDVIIDFATSGGQAIGRTPGDCPEIDQIVSVRGRGLKVGAISRVKITGADGYDLTGMKVTVKR